VIDRWLRVPVVSANKVPIPATGKSQDRPFAAAVGKPKQPFKLRVRFRCIGRLQCMDIAIATQPVGFMLKLSTTIKSAQHVDNAATAPEALAHRIEIATAHGTQPL